MATLVPFTCWRPPKELAEQVAAAPYDTLSRAEAVKEISQRPLSFLRIDRPAALFDAEIEEYDAQVYTRACAELDAWYEQGVMAPDRPSSEPAFFIYRLSQGKHQQTGLLACACVADYQSGTIKRHENTRAKKEMDRIEHIKALEAHTGPVLLTYPSVHALDALLLELTQITAPGSAHKAVTGSTSEKALGSAHEEAPASTPLYDFIAPDGVRHEIWRIDSREATQQIQSYFEDIPSLYIADGHHRAAAAASVAEWYAEGQLEGRDDAQHEAQQEAQQFLVAVFGSNELRVLDYNRVISDLAGLTPQVLLSAIEEVMDVEAQVSQPYRPLKRGELSMYLDGLWYKLTMREDLRPVDVVDGLDVALLHSLVLAPILKVEDPRSDPRITYIGGARGLTELVRRVDESGGVAFALYPCSLEELFAVANEDRLMPPKSTWFEPKPKSGLVIHRIRF